MMQQDTVTVTACSTQRYMILCVCLLLHFLCSHSALVEGNQVGCKHDVNLYVSEAGKPSYFNVKLQNFGKHDFETNGLGSTFIYAHFESQDALFSVTSKNTGSNNNFIVNYTAPLKGNYTVNVYHVLTDERIWIKVVTTSLDVTQGRYAYRYPSEYCDFKDIDPSFEGVWLKYNAGQKKEDFLRDGVVFSPRNCKYHVYGPAVDQHLERNSHIVFLGSSVTRGFFLSLADMIMQPGINDMQKCWGWGTYKAGQMQVSYQDFRVFAGSNVLTNIICHNNIIASNGNYFENSKHFLRELFQPRNSMKVPTTLVIQIEQLSYEELSHITLKILLSLFSDIPAGWNGNVVLLSALPYIGVLNNIKHKWIQQFKFLLQSKMLKEAHSFSIFFFDIYKLGIPYLWDLENGPFSFSQHFHKSCNEDKSSHNICSSVTEMVAQITLNIDLNKNNIGKEPQNWTSTKVEACIDCPVNLVPFQIKPIPNEKCGVLPDFPQYGSYYELKTLADDALPCPCMDHDVLRYAPSESKPIAVRACNGVFGKGP